MMDTRTKELLNHIHDTIHQILGHIQAEEDFRKSCLRFVEDEPETTPFPIEKVRQNAETKQKTTPDAGTSDEGKMGFVEFTDKEIKQMPSHFKKLIIIYKKRCHLRRHKSGKSFTYEIRFRASGYNLTACGKTIELAKENMMKKIRNTTNPTDTNVAPAIPTKLREFTVYYFEKFRIKKVSEQTYVNDEYRLKNHIFPYLGERELSSITPSDCETLINGMVSAGKARTAEDLFSLLSIIFKGAIAHGIIQRNPLDIVPRVRHERQHGKALSAQEEFELFQRAHGTPYEIFYAIILYCGLRPNELKTARIEGAFIVARNSKRKNQKIEYKKIPICKKLATYLNEIGNDLRSLDWRAEKTLSQRFPGFCPEHKLYDLRTTFYTRCKELGVADSARDAFVGHSLGVLGNSYTDLSDSYLLKEGKKLNKW